MPDFKDKLSKGYRKKVATIDRKIDEGRIFLASGGPNRIHQYPIPFLPKDRQTMLAELRKRLIDHPGSDDAKRSQVRIDEILEVQKRWRWIVGFIIAIITVLATLLGVFLSR